MAHTSSKSVIIVGGGIVGLTVAVAAQASGHKVTLISRDALEDIASGVAAGMIAPAMEAMNDADPAFSYQRLKEAQGAWIGLMGLWPQSLQLLWSDVAEGHSYFVWPASTPLPDPLKATGADLREATPDLAAGLGLGPDQQAVRVVGDGNVSAMHLLQAFEAHLQALGGIMVRGAVEVAEPGRVHVAGIGWISGDEVVIAAGYDSQALGVAALEPIKGHLLDLPSRRPPVVLRGTTGYLATRIDGERFGATMQPGQSGTTVDSEAVADLKRRAGDLFPDLQLDEAVPRVGVRAATPDGWPLIGRDPAKGLLVATGVRRNGYIFAPLAAKIILALIAGEESPDGGIYRPDRFS